MGTCMENFLSTVTIGLVLGNIQLYYHTDASVTIDKSLSYPMYLEKHSLSFLFQADLCLTFCYNDLLHAYRAAVLTLCQPLNNAF